MNVEVCCWVLLWSYLHLGRDHLPDTSLVFSITSPSVISTMTVVSSAIMGSVVWEITQSYVKRAYSIGLSTCAWGNPHAHSCSLMLNWFQTLILTGCMWWIHLSTSGSFGAGYALDSLSQSSQRDLFIHADPHMAKFRLPSEPNMYIFGLWGRPSCPERPHTDQTGPLGFCKQPYLRILPSLCLQQWIAALLLK